MRAGTLNCTNPFRARKLLLPSVRSSRCASLNTTASLNAGQHLHDPTLQSLLIGKHTRVIYQGFTGRVATQNARDSLEYGTNIVGGVKPGACGEHLGLPICSSVRIAKDQLRPDATAIFVPMTGAAAAIEEAIEAEIPLIVAVAEHIPVYDMLRIREMLQGSASRLVGANSPGIIAPLGSCRIGFQPLPIYKPGRVGVIAKSGTLSYEAVASLTRAGLGQSLCVGCGGDPVSGTTIEEAFAVLVKDPNTEGIVVVGEVGGMSELLLASQIEQYRQNSRNPKPITALVAGRRMPQKRVMGHAGAFIGPRDPSAEDKFRALEQSGAVMVDHPEKFGPVMQKLLTTSKINGSTQSKGGPTSQRRGYHTIRRPPEYLQIAPSARQARCLHLDGEKAASLVRSALPDFDVTESTPSPSSIQVMSTIDRISARINVQLRPRGRSDDASDESTTLETSHSPSGGSKGTDKHSLEQVAGSRESLKDTPFANFEPCRERLTSGVADFMRTHEALSMQLLLSLNNDNKPVLSSPTIHFDDSAYKSGKRQEVVFAKRDKSAEDQSEVVAEEHGIVYITLDPTDQSASIGTLVNGAGLAMNTVDVLSLPPYNVKCANFLDTGGKATSDTVKKSFELILRDSRIKVIFVNIFGGLTDCAMIADGVMLAFKDVDMRGLPVVVRLRGTNEEEGQRKIAESGLALEAFDQFEDAARRVAELANA